MPGDDQDQTDALAAMKDAIRRNLSGIPGLDPDQIEAGIDAAEKGGDYMAAMAKPTGGTPMRYAVLDRSTGTLAGVGDTPQEAMERWWEIEADNNPFHFYDHRTAEIKIDLVSVTVDYPLADWIEDAGEADTSHYDAGDPAKRVPYTLKQGVTPPAPTSPAKTVPTHSIQSVLAGHGASVQQVQQAMQRMASAGGSMPPVPPAPGNTPGGYKVPPPNPPEPKTADEKFRELFGDDDE